MARFWWSAVNRWSRLRHRNFTIRLPVVGPSRARLGPTTGNRIVKFRCRSRDQRLTADHQNLAIQQESGGVLFAELFHWLDEREGTWRRRTRQYGRESQN